VGFFWNEIKMEEEEVDAWYEEEKQKIFDKYLENINSLSPNDSKSQKRISKRGKNREEIEKEYKEGMKKTRERYMHLYEKSKLPTFSEKYFGWIKKFMNKLEQKKTDFIEKHAEKMENFKKKITKIIPTKR